MIGVIAGEINSRSKSTRLRSRGSRRAGIRRPLFGDHLRPGNSRQTRAKPPQLRVDRLRERVVFEMKHYQGLKLRTIGEMLNTTEETAKNTLFRATQKLRVALVGMR